jgi:hypothetical protein
MNSSIPVIRPRNRRLRQKGSEILEFALFAFFLVPTFVWTFVNAMNLLRIIEATHVCRDIGNLYIHGVDYTTFEAQQVAAKLATGFDLRIGTTFTGSNAANTANQGRGLVVLSQVMYVGSNTCGSLPAGTVCTNANKYVFLQRVMFGKGDLTINSNQVVSSLGNVNNVVFNSSGFVQNYLTDPDAVAPNAGTFFSTGLTDGQVAYVAETFFSSPDLQISAFPGGGLHNTLFF